MKPYLDDVDFRLFQGDALEVLRTLEAGSVQMCVTSPPFYGLRDYGTGSWVGGDHDCDHTPRAQVSGSKTSTNVGQLRDKPSSRCRCGASRVDQQIGLEETPEQWVEKLVGVFREVRRVLRVDGTLWVEVGDSYARNGGDGRHGPNAQVGSTKAGIQRRMMRVPETQEGLQPAAVSGLSFGALKEKDLVGAPWMLAFALRADGWYLRSDIVWSRPNPMPESVTDRPTKSHSYIFMLSKSPRYFWDADAIREPHMREWDASNGGNLGRRKEWPTFSGGEGQGYPLPNPAGRNVRSVWDIPTQPYPEAHFATYPEELVRRCILAGSRQGDTVLDCFIGSGTTALVARKHGRRTIGIELSADYCELAARRLSQLSLLSEVRS